MTFDPEFFTEPEFLAKEKKLNELVNEVRQKILGKQSQFTCLPRTDDDFLVKFIRCKKYEPDEAVTAIQKYYKHIFDISDLIHNKYPQALESIYEAKNHRLLRQKIRGKFITYIHIENWNPNIHTFEDTIVAAGFQLEEMWLNKYHQIKGFSSICDFSGFSMCHARNLPYRKLKTIAKCMFEMYPIRVKAVHLINFPRIFWPIHLMITKLFPKKLQSRVYLHKNVTSLAKALDSQALPVSLGGILTEDEAWDTEMLAKLLKENKSYESRWNATGDC